MYVCVWGRGGGGGGGEGSGGGGGTAPCTAHNVQMNVSPTEHSTGLLYKDGMLTKLGPAMDLMVYNQHHCWLLLSSLCLSAANTVNRASNKGEPQRVHVGVWALGTGVHVGMWSECGYVGVGM